MHAIINNNQYTFYKNSHMIIRNILKEEGDIMELIGFYIIIFLYLLVLMGFYYTKKKRVTLAIIGTTLVLVGLVDLLFNTQILSNLYETVLMFFEKMDFTFTHLIITSILILIFFFILVKYKNYRRGNLLLLSCCNNVGYSFFNTPNDNSD
jgi:hypothetical protein